MQEAGVQLGQACWDVKQSTSRISVSCFWPNLLSKPQQSSAQMVSKSKKRRNRRKNKIGARDQTKAGADGENLNRQQSEAGDTPIKAHSDPESDWCPASVPIPSDDGLNPVIETDHIDIAVDDDPNVFYLERGYIPGVCVESGEMSSWTPIKISRSRIRAANSDTSDDDILVNECLSLDYQPVDGEPGFEIETNDDTFWAPVAHRTRTHLKSVET